MAPDRPRRHTGLRRIVRNRTPYRMSRSFARRVCNLRDQIGMQLADETRDIRDERDVDSSSVFLF